MDVHSILLGNGHDAAAAAVKAALLFLSAIVVLRLTERRTLAELAPFDWVAAVAVGAIVGRTATASDTSWLTGAAALAALMVTHTIVARLRFLPLVRRIVDPPLLVLVHQGDVNRRNLRRCGLTKEDLEAILRQHGHPNLDQVHLAIFETKGRVSVLSAP